MFSRKGEKRVDFMTVKWNPQTKMTIVNNFCTVLCGRMIRTNCFRRPISVDVVVVVAGKMSNINLIYEIHLVGSRVILQRKITLKESKIECKLNLPKVEDLEHELW